MRVQKRNGRGYEEVQFGKITDRIKHLCWGLGTNVNPTLIAQKTIMNMFDGISTEHLDTISAGIAESYKLEHPDYALLAARILISNLHKMTPGKFSECMKKLYDSTGLISPQHLQFIMDNAEMLDAMIIDENDYLFDYLGYKTMEVNYLNKITLPVIGADGNPVYTLDDEVVPSELVEFRDGRAVTVVDMPVYKIDDTVDGKPRYKNNRGVIVDGEVTNVNGVFMMKGAVRALQMKTIDRVMDRPQYMFMRVAIAINDPRFKVLTKSDDKSNDKLITANQLELGLTFSKNGLTGDMLLGGKDRLEAIKRCYKLMSQQYFTHATPTLFNACAKNQQLLSCFLQGTSDSIEGINKTITNSAIISKGAGGIGIHMSNIRSCNQRIKGTNGKSSGLPKQLKIYNESANTWDQGGRRKGAFAIYLEPWHGDIMQFLRMKLNQGSESERARDLFYALWVPDLFVYCAENKYDWSLFSEDTAPGLSDVYDGMMVCELCGYCSNKAYGKYVNRASVEVALDDPNTLYTEHSDEYYRLKANYVIDGNAAEPNSRQQKCSISGHKYAPVDAFTQLYCRYESEGRAVGSINAGEIMDAICEMQRESGTPYICHKDTINRMSNQSGIGTIKSSNLCCEITEWSSESSYACCTLASINLRKFLVELPINRVVDNGVDNELPSTGNATGNGIGRRDSKWVIDHQKLHEVTMLIAKNLDIIIDVNKYPVQECHDNSVNYRPIGIGVQGLANVFAVMKIPFISDEAARVDLEIFETIYHAAVSASVERAKLIKPFTGFENSPAARGLLAPDLWLVNQQRINSPVKDTQIYSGRYDFGKLRSDVMTHGMRNSLLIAPMPTVSSSQILGNNESFEPFASNMSTKTTLGGKFTMANNHMIEHLMSLGLWNERIRTQIMNNEGSVQGIKEIPDDVKALYLTTWEMKQTEIMKRAAVRQAFVDQSQSLNIHVADNSNKTLRGVFFWGAKLGLKTGSYYVRTKPNAAAMKNNIAMEKAIVAQRIARDAIIDNALLHYDPDHCKEGLIDELQSSNLSNPVGFNKVPISRPTDAEEVCTMQEGCLMCGS